MLIFIWSFVFIKTFIILVFIFDECRKSKFFKINKEFIKKLDTDKFIFYGEARSHCVKNTIKDIQEPAKYILC